MKTLLGTTSSFPCLKDLGFLRPRAMNLYKATLISVAVLLASGCTTYQTSPAATTVVEKTTNADGTVTTTTTTTDTPTVTVAPPQVYVTPQLYVAPYIAPRYVAPPSSYWHQPRYGYGNGYYNNQPRFRGGLNGTIYW